ncbi:class I SAM-dependent methyltransferase [Mycobacterium sp. URHD0025]|uniref:class I SAM-dependent methyltransferase n=1 Tax=Mycobacterium sp. URHD0025 TaxID=1298864 RepID=UPI0003FA71F6|nr:class I SAM-dependent methyltransferase [Mycobacterium sp. URHD0025]
MSDKDRIRWDAAYADREPVSEPGLPQTFSGQADVFPLAGSALDVACGTGRVAVWLARRGLHVWGLDVSPVAVTQARQSAVHHGVADRCRFDVIDLDDGLPPGPPVDVIVCHRFRDRSLYPAMVERLAPGGILAINVLSEVGAEPGRFRAAAGELTTAFAGLDVMTEGEGGGEAWLLARRRRA